MTNEEEAFTKIYHALDMIKLNCGGNYRFELIDAVKDIEEAVQVIRDQIDKERMKSIELDMV